MASGTGNFVPLPFFFDEDPNKDGKQTTNDNQPSAHFPTNDKQGSVNQQSSVGQISSFETGVATRKKSSFDLPSYSGNLAAPWEAQSQQAPWRTSNFDSPSKPSSWKSVEESPINPTEVHSQPSVHPDQVPEVQFPVSNEPVNSQFSPFSSKPVKREFSPFMSQPEQQQQKQQFINSFGIEPEKKSEPPTQQSPFVGAPTSLPLEHPKQHSPAFDVDFSPFENRTSVEEHVNFENKVTSPFERKSSSENKTPITSFTEVQQPPWSTPQEVSTASVNVPWNSAQSVETSSAITQVSWQQPLPVQKKNSSDSEKSTGSGLHYHHFNQQQQLPPLEGIDETLSTKSFASSFVIEGGKACSRCSKNNEVNANFCSRCGAHIASPIESPSSSQICSSLDGSSVVQDQFAKLSITQPQFAPSFELNQPHIPSSVELNQTQFAHSFDHSERQVSSSFENPFTPSATSPKEQARRVFPIFSFGFGGNFVLTFPTLQTRYTPTGQPINSFRPSLVFTGELASLPNAKSALIESFTEIADGAPLLEKAGKPNELSQILSILSSSTIDSNERILLNVFEVILRHPGKLIENRESVDQIRSILAPLITEPQNSSSRKAVNEIALNDVELSIRNGDREGAIEIALSSGFWAHAILLGHFSSPASFQRAVDQFTQHNYPPGHPNRLIYLMLSGQLHLIEAELTKIGPEIVDQWPGIIIGILSNRISPSDNSIFIMVGDALSKYNHRASQFCYLISMDDTIFSSGRITLFGKKDFIQNIRITEIYEAIRHSFDPSFSLVHLFPMKLLYVTLLAECGHMSLALRHCNALGSLLKKSHWKDVKFLEMFESILNRLEVYAEGNPKVKIVSEESGWFPKVTGIMNVIDKGLNKVIGVEETSKIRSPIMPQVNVEVERLDPPVPPFFPQTNEHITPVRGFDPFGRKSSVESRISSSPKPWEHQQSETIISHVNVPSQSISLPSTSAAQSSMPPMDFNLQYQVQQPFVPQREEEASMPPTDYNQQYRPPMSPTPVQQWETWSNTSQPPIPPNDFSHQEAQQPPLPFNQATTSDFNQPWNPQPQPQQLPHQHQQQPSWSSAPFLSHSPSQMFQPAPVQIQQQSMPNLTAPIDDKPHQLTTSPGTMSMDDFGFGNASSQPKPTELKKSESPALGGEDNKDSDAGSKGSLFGGLIKGIFGRKKDSSSPALSAGSTGLGAVQANLGESEMKLVYDENLKKWVSKDTGAPPVSEVIAPPPPSINSSPMGAATTDPMAFRKVQSSGSGVRGRYVDAFGSGINSNAAPSTIPKPPLNPTPSFTNLSLEPQSNNSAPIQCSPDAVNTVSQQNNIAPQNQRNSPPVQYQPPQQQQYQQPFNQQQQYQQPFNPQQQQQPPFSSFYSNPSSGMYQ